MTLANESGRPRAPWNWSDAAILLVFLVITVVCYGNILNNSFVYDDGQQILQNPYVKSWHFLPQIFGTTVWSFVGQAGTTNYYRPLMTFTFLVLWQIFGPIPFGFHLFSLVLQFAVVAMVFYAGRRLFNDARIAFFAALLFSIHPIHTEVVDWIAAVPDLEAALFLLIALYLLSEVGVQSWKSSLSVLLCFGLALLSKEPSLMFAPLAIYLGYDVRRSSGGEPRAFKIFRYGSLCALSAAYIGLRILLFGKVAPVLQRPKLTWPEAFYSAFALVWSYTKLLFWPWPLSAFHVFRPSTAIFEPQVLAGITILAICVLAIWRVRKTSPAAAFALLWTGFTLAPVLNARWMAANVLAERYLYLPSIGACWFIAWWGTRVWSRATASGASIRWLGPAAVAAGAMLAVLAVRVTIVRNRDWRTDLSLYTRTLETDPDAHIIRANRASVLFDTGDFRQAEWEWKIALQGKPDSVNTMNALGILYTREERYPEAQTMLRQAVQLKPLWADAHFNLGSLLAKTGEHSQALAELCRAAELAPLNSVAHYLYGKELLQAGDATNAERELTTSLKLDRTPEALQELAKLYVKEGRLELAEQTLRQVLQQSPLDGHSHLALGKILVASGRRQEGAREFTAVLQTDARNPEALAGLKGLEASGEIPAR